MSLQLAAQHLAHHGRGNDKMLVHMTPKEVSGLQQLAQAHGGSLTVNPQTGLPEAGVLDSLLPTIIGAGLTYFSGGAINPMMAAGLVGGIQGVRTGDLGKGLMAGLGAYGGAGLAAGLAETGVGAMTTAGVGDYTSSLAEKGIYPTLESGAPNPAFGEAAGKLALESQKQALGASMGDKFSAGFNAATASPDAAMDFAKNNYKSGLMALSPIIADRMVQTTTPSQSTNKPEIHPFRYNENGTFTRQSPIDASLFKGFGYADGGMIQDNSTGMFNYANMQPAVNLNSGIGAAHMANGGVAHYEGGGRVFVPDSTDNEGGGTYMTPQEAQQYLGGNSVYNQADLIRAGATMPTTAATAAATPFSSNPLVMAQNPAFTGTPTAFPTNGGGLQPIVPVAQALGLGNTTPAAATPPPGLTDQQIFDWFKTNQGGSDATINNAINQYKVNLGQLSKVTGVGLPEITDRQNIVNDITAFGNTLTPTTVAPTNGIGGISAAVAAADKTAFGNDAKWIAYLDSHKDASGKLDPISIFEVSRATGIPENALLARYDAAKPGSVSLGDGGGGNVNTGSDGGGGDGGGGLPPPFDGGGGDTETTNTSSVSLGDGGGGDTETPICAKGYHYDPTTHTCVLDVVTNTSSVSLGDGGGGDTEIPICAKGYHYDPKTKSCVLDAVTFTDGSTKTVVPKVDVPTSIATAPTDTLPTAIAGTTGPAIVSGGTTVNPNGTVTVSPRIPDIPVGGFTGMSQVRDAYTKGGGSLGYVPKAPKTIEEFYKQYGTQSGGSKQAYDYLFGKSSENPILHPYTPTGEIARPYAESVLGYPSNKDVSQKAFTFDPTTKKYIKNPDFIPMTYDKTSGKQIPGRSLNQIRTDMNTLKNDSDWLNYMDTNHIEPQQIADATGLSIGEVLQHIEAARGNGGSSGSGVTATSGTPTKLPNGITATPLTQYPGYSKGTDGKYYDKNGNKVADTEAQVQQLINEVPLASGGIADIQMYSSGGIGDLGSYSDGGRLLRGPGDGVSDSIPATIGKGRPARLADGEFVVPARIVSELGNGSTEAGARKLYAMMDRVQNTRGRTIGKGKVATNTRADKFLPV